MLTPNRQTAIKVEMDRIEAEMADLDSLTPSQVIMLNARLDTLLLELLASVDIIDTKES